jgi:hypothetical protein
MKTMKLSSNWTKTALFGNLIVTLIMVPIFLFVFTTQNFHAGMVFGLLILIVLIILAIYLFTYGCEAYVEGEDIILKKLFKPEVKMPISSIYSIKSFKLKQTKYTSLNFKNNFKFIIINSTSFLEQNKVDAEKILLEIQKEIKLRMKSSM